MKFLKTIFYMLMLTVTFSFSAFAETGDYQLVLHTGSKHFQKGFNGKNPGLGLRIKDGGETYYQAGVYYNSVKRTTFYTIYGYEPFSVSNVTFGGFVGLASGYGVTSSEGKSYKCAGSTCTSSMMEVLTKNNNITPVAGLTATVHFEKLKLIFVGMPTVGKSAGSLSLSALFPF
jgi:hypothetical protein